MQCHLHSFFHIQVELKKLEIDENLKRSQVYWKTEISAGLYPPSLKFIITYVCGKVNYCYMRKPHMVSLNGCEAGNEVSFLVEVFEPPALPLGTYV